MTQQLSNRVIPGEDSAVRCVRCRGRKWWSRWSTGPRPGRAGVVDRGPAAGAEFVVAAFAVGDQLAQGQNQAIGVLTARADAETGAQRAFRNVEPGQQRVRAELAVPDPMPCSAER